jgi:hypothetical protein
MSTIGTALAELEREEFHTVTAMGRMVPGTREYARAREALAAARVAKALLLRRNPDILRKSGAAKSAVIGLPVAGAAITKTIREAGDRFAEERRLSQRVGDEFERFRQAYPGRVQILDGRTLPLHEAMRAAVAGR